MLGGPITIWSKGLLIRLEAILYPKGRRAVEIKSLTVMSGCTADRSLSVEDITILSGLIIIIIIIIQTLKETSIFHITESVKSSIVSLTT